MLGHYTTGPRGVTVAEHSTGARALQTPPPALGDERICLTNQAAAPA